MILVLPTVEKKLCNTIIVVTMIVFFYIAVAVIAITIDTVTSVTVTGAFSVTDAIVVVSFN